MQRWGSFKGLSPTNRMNAKIASQLRHLATFVPGLGGFLLAQGWLDADTAAQLDAEQVKMLAIVAGALAVMISRALLWLLGKYAPQFLPFFGNGGAGSSPLLILTTAAAFSMAGLSLSSCSLSMTGDGCVLGEYQRNGRTYKAGPCVDALGKVNRLRFAWLNEKGQELRATVFQDREKPTEIDYHAGGGLWLRWTRETGISLGALPPDLESAVKEGAVKVSLVTEVEREIQPTK